MPRLREDLFANPIWQVLQTHPSYHFAAATPYELQNQEDTGHSMILVRLWI